MSKVNSDFWFWWHHVGWRFLSFPQFSTCSLVLSYHKRSHQGCFCRPHPKGSAISAFNPLAAQRCVLHRQGFSSSVFQEVMGASTSGWSTSNGWKELASWCAQEGVPNTAISAPKLAVFLFIYLGLARLGVWLVFIILQFLLFWNLIIFTKFPIILLSLN